MEHPQPANEQPFPEACMQGECASQRPPGEDRGQSGLVIALVITSVVMVAEAVGGWLTNSLALLADAGHMLTDAGALALSLFAIWFASRPAPAQKTYGYLRFEILAALVNGVTLVVISGAIFWEAWQRFQDPPAVRSGLMLVIAIIGLVANLVSAWVLHRAGHAHAHSHGHGDCGHGHQEHNLNIRGAYLHVLGDALGSVGAIGAALCMMIWGWALADPLISVVIGAIISLGAIRLVWRSVDVLMEATPRHIDLEAMEARVLEVPGVHSLHDLHVWTITSGVHAMTAHVVVAPETPLCRDSLLQDISRVVRQHFGIEHTTIQLEGLQQPAPAEP